MQTMSTTSGTHMSPLGLVKDWWRRYWNSRMAVEELSSCGDAEIGNIARDVGVSPSDLRTLAGKWPASTNLLDRRVAATGIDLEEVQRTEPQVVRDLQRVCAFCGDRSRCERDLDVNQQDRVWRDYCPNVATLDALRSEDRDRRYLRRPKWRSF
jgi:hypothetical protein